MPPEQLMGGNPMTMDSVEFYVDHRYPESEEDPTRFVVHAFVNRATYIKNKQLAKAKLLFLGLGVVIGALVASGICNLVN